MAKGSSGMGASLRKGGPLDQEFDGSQGTDARDYQMTSAVAREFPDHISGSNSTEKYTNGGKASLGTLGARGQAEG